MSLDEICNRRNRGAEFNLENYRVLSLSYGWDRVRSESPRALTAERFHQVEHLHQEHHRNLRTPAQQHRPRSSFQTAAIIWRGFLSFLRAPCTFSLVEAFFPFRRVNVFHLAVLHEKLLCEMLEAAGVAPEGGHRQRASPPPKGAV